MKHDTLPDAHPNLSPALNAKVAQTLIEGGADLTKLPVGRALIVKTENTTYRIERVKEGRKDCPFLISGHPRICPEPVRAGISGSTFDRGGMLRMAFVGRQMNMEFYVQGNSRTYSTTTISEIEEVDAKADSPATE